MLVCQECGQECIKDRIYCFDGRTRLCAFCYRWAMMMNSMSQLVNRAVLTRNNLVESLLGDNV